MTNVPNNVNVILTDMSAPVLLHIFNLKSCNNVDNSIIHELYSSGGNGGGSNQDLRSRLNARSRDPEPPPHDNGEQEQRRGGRGGRGGGGGGHGQNGRQNHRRVQGPGAGGTVAERKQQANSSREPRKGSGAPQQAAQSNGVGLPRPKRNTENFNPSHEPPQMRVLFAPSGLKRYLDHRSYTTRDVLVVNDLVRSGKDHSCIIS